MRQYDPETQAAVEIIEADEAIRNMAEMEKEERDRRMIECYQKVGMIKGIKLVRDFGKISTFLWVQDFKKSKRYRDIQGIETWDKFCKSIGYSTRYVDEQLQNLNTLGVSFLEAISDFQVGFKEMRRLRQLTSDGEISISDSAVEIGGQRIPLSPDHKDDLQEALERIIEAKQDVIEEKDAVIRANEKLIESKQDLIRKQEKEIARFEKEAKAKGLTPAEDAFCQKCENSRITIDGFLNQFDPNIKPLPEDATPRMKAALMHTLAWFKRCITASYDTAAELYGDPEIDGCGWIPPHMRQEETDQEV